jgi:hypothetical protein
MSEPVNLNPAGGLGQAAQPAQPPAYQSNPYGYAANPALLAAAMDPNKIMGMLNSKNLMSDEDIRRNKFFAGLSGPTRSGSVGESFSNALNNEADMGMEQKKLIAQYAPLMAQHMLGAYNASITGAEKNSKLLSDWQAGLNSHVAALLRSGAPVTPEVLEQVVNQTGTEYGVPVSYRQTYLQGLTGGASPGADVSGALRTRLLAGQTPEKAQGLIAPPVKGQDVGPKIVPNAESGSPGFTPPQNMPQTLTKGIAPVMPEPKTETDKFGNATVNWNGRHAIAETPEAFKIWQDYYAAKAADAAHAGPTGTPPAPQPGQAGPAPAPAPQGGTPPGPQAGPPQGGPPQGGPPPLPQQYPPGTRGSIPLPPQAASQGAAQSAQQPVPKAPVAPGAVVVPDNRPDPALTPDDKKTTAGSVPVGATVRFTDIPQAPPLLTPAGGMSPINEQKQKDALTAFQKDTEDQTKTLSSMQETLRRMNVIQDIAKRVQLGSTAGVREDVSSVLADLGRYMPGLSNDTVTRITNGVAGGDRAALQEFEKLTVSGAMVSLRADIGSSAGQRIAMQEYMQYLKAVPNINMDPMAIAKLREVAIRDYMRARTEQDARAQFLKSPSADYTQFGSWWADKQQRLNLVPQNMNISGGKGTGIPFHDVQFTRNAQGEVVASDGRKDKNGATLWFKPNEKFLTSW